MVILAQQHDTSRDDIELLIDPVVIAPLRREWAESKATVEALLTIGSKKPGTLADIIFILSG